MTQSDYLNPAFVERLMRQHAPKNDIRVFDVRPLAIDNSASILAALTAGLSDTIIGHLGLAVTFRSGGVRQTRRMVLKIKPPGSAIVAMLNGLAGACGGTLAEVYPTYKDLTGFLHTDQRELEVYGKLPSSLQPDIFGLLADPEQGTYVILMEYLDDVALMNSVLAPHTWTDGHIRQALDQLAVWHADHLNRPLPIDPTYWDDAPSRAYMTRLTPLWTALLDNAAQQAPALYTPARVARLNAIIRSIPDYWHELEQLAKALVHNDLNPRNTCFKSVNGASVFCVYDWELATYHVPQYDVVELLCFVLDTDRYHLRPVYLDHYRNALHQLTGLYADEQAFKRGFDLAAFDFGLHRLGMYMMAHSVSPYPFLPRVVNSYFDMLEKGFSNRA
ncbi:aminoglycoside phosphotransferase family protein [Fibrella aquatilis]|uniref:Phosphotransferase n=1 Tax=Fibrella aquatilis TaxID=2817059 RepID=A0A939GBF8_9BACT|nr:aminoglycoside phosphotransferase family protein [Fibrella aquatilis]MBO0933780.1 phosphotransferase [Fibrella aquatilis]